MKRNGFVGFLQNRRRLKFFGALRGIFSRCVSYLSNLNSACVADRVLVSFDDGSQRAGDPSFFCRLDALSLGKRSNKIEANAL